ncbi:MAG: hypothetical protein AAFP90_05065 [Planctomycetota bacterium]
MSPTISLLLLIGFFAGPPATWRETVLPQTVSCRAVSVSPNGKTLCIAGAGPRVWISTDGGDEWNERTPSIPGVTDYRCAVQPTNETLLIASAGSPAVILRSDDLGQHWKTAYKNDHPSAFIDSMKFWDAKRGIAFGDPVDGRFLLMQTTDGGATWNAIDGVPPALDGEAGFAASNQSIAVFGDGNCVIGLGGQTKTDARVLLGEQFGTKWSVVTVQNMASGPSKGIFAIAADSRPEVGKMPTLIAVGGDYKNPQQRAGNFAISVDAGRTWSANVETAPGGYRSSIIHIPGSSSGAKTARWIATGPTGTDISEDGRAWRPHSLTGFHALAGWKGHSIANENPPRQVSRFIAVGSEGRVGHSR